MRFYAINHTEQLAAFGITIVGVDCRERSVITPGAMIVKCQYSRGSAIMVEVGSRIMPTVGTLNRTNFDFVGFVDTVGLKERFVLSESKPAENEKEY